MNNHKKNLITFFQAFKKEKEDFINLNTNITEKDTGKLKEKEKNLSSDLNLNNNLSKVTILKIGKISSPNKNLITSEKNMIIKKEEIIKKNNCIINIDIYYPESEKEYNLYKNKKREFLSQFKNSKHISINNIDLNSEKKNILVKNLKIPLLTSGNLNLNSEKLKKRSKNFFPENKNTEIFFPNLKKKNVFPTLKIIPPFQKFLKIQKREYNKHSLYTAPEKNNIKFITPSNQETSWYKNFLKIKILKKKSSKMNSFWRGKNKSYPFTFKKVVNEIFDSTNEESPFLIYDISNKLTSNFDDF